MGKNNKEVLVPEIEEEVVTQEQPIEEPIQEVMVEVIEPMIQQDEESVIVKPDGLKKPYNVRVSKTSILNVRSERNATSKVLAKLNRNANIKIELDELADEKIMFIKALIEDKITKEQIIGYVKKEFIEV